jgi:hypothetical protein
MPKFTEATLKRLFALSGNVCAFPNCTYALVDPTIPSRVLGEICHIEGENDGSARWRRDQSEQERNAFANLILMCGHHHSVIDADPATWTVASLVDLKERHESDHSGKLSREDVEALLAALVNKLTKGGSIYLSGADVRAGHGVGGEGGSARFRAGDGPSGGDIHIGPGNYRAGDGGPGGKGGDLEFRAGDAR